MKLAQSMIYDRCIREEGELCYLAMKEGEGGFRQKKTKSFGCLKDNQTERERGGERERRRETERERGDAGRNFELEIDNEIEK